MNAPSTAAAVVRSAATSRWLGLLGVGFVYWLILLLALEPDNMIRAAYSGDAFDFRQETLRIVGAASLGACAMPMLAAFARRFPIAGPFWLRRAAVQAIGCGVVAAALVAVSCVLADRLLSAEHRLLAVALWDELVGNWALLTLWLMIFVVGLLAVAHLSPRAKSADPDRDKPLETVSIRSRGVLRIVDLNDVEWIEAQGNYLTLHTATGSHLIRASLASLAGRLDRARFVRVHRRAIVAIDRIVAIRSRGAGDAELELRGGAQVRVSRTHRVAVEQTLRPSAANPP